MHADFNQTQPRLTATLGEWLATSSAFQRISRLSPRPELRRSLSQRRPRTEAEVLAEVVETGDEPDLPGPALG